LLTGDREKVHPILDFKILRADQFGIRFMDQSGGLEHVSGPLASQLPGSNPVQLAVDQGDGFVARLTVSVLHLGEQKGKVFRLLGLRSRRAHFGKYTAKPPGAPDDGAIYRFIC
jgi:hypothetical protein